MRNSETLSCPSFPHFWPVLRAGNITRFKYSSIVDSNPSPLVVSRTPKQSSYKDLKKRHKHLGNTLFIHDVHVHVHVCISTSTMLDVDTCLLILGLKKNRQMPVNGSLQPSVASTRFMRCLLGAGPRPECKVSSSKISIKQ